MGQDFLDIQYTNTRWCQKSKNGDIAFHVSYNLSIKIDETLVVIYFKIMVMENLIEYLCSINKNQSNKNIVEYNLRSIYLPLRRYLVKYVQFSCYVQGLGSEWFFPDPTFKKNRSGSDLRKKTDPDPTLEKHRIRSQSTVKWREGVQRVEGGMTFPLCFWPKI